MNALNNIQTLLPWSEPRNVSTKNGPRVVRSASPTPTFWGAWRNNQAALKAAGISLSQYKGAWQVSWWQDPNAPASPEPQETAAPAAAAPAEVSVSVPAIDSAPVAIAVAQERIWSDEQKAIFEWFKTGTGNLVVRARAGTGKTTTIKEAFSFAPEERMLYAVFNKKNQKEAEEKITDNRVEIRTLHSLGFAYIQQFWTGTKADDDVEFDRINSVFHDLPQEVGTQIKRLVGFAKNTTIDPTIDDLADIADDRSIECPGFEEPESGGWTVRRLAEIAFKVMELSKKRDPQGRISFNDMVWLPVVMNWVLPWFDLVCVDETQDMSLPQLVMVQRAAKKVGRICVVGDDKQAIYGFRGATSDGMDMMKQQLNAKELGLTTTYRCPKQVVALANKLVPDYNAAPSAPEGVIEVIGEGMLLDKAKVGDAVLSRVNAPLMPFCLQLLRKGIPARIEGRDIGKALVSLVKSMKAKSVPHFIQKIERWGEKMKARALKSRHSEEKCEQINDQVLTLVAVAEGSTSVWEIEKRLLDLFQDSDKNQKPAVTFSSVHKAKGMEFPKVFVLENTFNRRSKPGTKPDPQSEQEERNIKYVAYTRAMHHLVLVGGQSDTSGVKEQSDGSKVGSM